MIRYLLRSKIHRATVTEAHLDYVGSITIDAELMDQADICPYERVLVVDVDNGSRLETYAIEGSPGSGTIGMNGAAARLVHPGDRVIIMSFGGLDSQEAAGHRPRVVFVDERNRLQSVGAEDAVHDPFGVEATAGGSSTGDAR